MSNKLKFSLIALSILVVGWFTFRAIMFKYIQPNEVGVWMTNGGMNGASDYQVWQGHFPIDFNPLTKSFTLPAQPWTLDLPARPVYSKENGEWTVDPSFTFSIDRTQAPLVCWKNNSLIGRGDDKFLEDVGQHILTPIINNAFTEILGSLRDTVMMNDKVRVQKTLEDSVRIYFKRLGFNLENFVTGVTPPKAILETNKAKNNALQAVYKAKADVEQANAQAAVKIAEARANSEAMLVTARAEAEATRLKQSVLSSLMIQQMWIEKWDGKLPTYQGGQNTLMQIPNK